MQHDFLNLIDGKLEAPSKVLGGELRDANTGALLGAQPDTDKEAVERALAAAARVHSSGEWSSMPLTKRVEALARVAEECRKVHPQLPFYLVHFVCMYPPSITLEHSWTNARASVNTLPA